jgi:hypothetical protein
MQNAKLKDIALFRERQGKYYDLWDNSTWAHHSPRNITMMLRNPAEYCRSCRAQKHAYSPQTFDGAQMAF